MTYDANNPQLDDVPRRTLSVWWYIIGIFAIMLGAYLLFVEDTTHVRTLQPPRAEAPSFSVPGELRTAVALTNRFADAGDVASKPFTDAFFETVWREAEVVGVRRGTFERAIETSRTPDPSVLVLSANQPEFDRTAGDYVTSMVNADRIAVGRARLEQNATILGDIERRFGVDRHVLLAIWGIESNYGASKGDRNVIRSLATLAAGDPRRAAFWRSELVAAMSIMEQDKISAQRMIGSWAGAMGHTQFMPSAYLKYAVDFDSDGVRDVWSSVPDALASAARHLQANGWAAGRSWGKEVVLPADFDYAQAAPGTARSFSAWRQVGVRALMGSLPADDQSNSQLIVPSGAGGPAFLVSTNFDAILNYNHSYSYAIAVGALADRIAGNVSVQAAWPAADVPMTRDQRIELQEILTSLGYDVGGVDGIIGIKSRDAIRNFQKARGIAADGHPSIALLGRIRSDRRL